MKRTRNILLRLIGLLCLAGLALGLSACEYEDWGHHHRGDGWDGHGWDWGHRDWDHHDGDRHESHHDHH